MSFLRSEGKTTYQITIGRNNNNNKIAQLALISASN